MKEEKLIGDEKIRALFSKIVIPGARLGVQNRGSKTYRTIEREPGILTREQERAVRALVDKVRIQRWGAVNENYYIFFDE